MNHLKPNCPSRWLLTVLASLTVAACGGGGGNNSTATINATVAAQVQSLKPTSNEDSVGVFVELDTTKLIAAAQSNGDAQAQQRALQNAFLTQLVQAAQTPATAGASSTGCDVAQLTKRIKEAYLPTSGAAVRLELNNCEFDILPSMAFVKGVHSDLPLASQNSASTVSAINTAVKYSFDSTTVWPKYSAKAADGSGVVVAVLDTGVELNHPAFANKLEKGACFSTPTTGGQTFCPNGTSVDTTSATAGQSCIGSFGDRHLAHAAGCGHGTSMAGVAAMNYTNGTIISGGVASNASILPIQVFTGGIGSGAAIATASIYANSGDLLRAIEWLTIEAQRRIDNNLPRIAAVNMSLGGGSYTSACDTDFTGKLFKTAFASLRDQGVLPVAAAGNEAKDSAVSFPACISEVVAVGATKLGSGDIASYSNISPQVRVFAQGGDRGNTYSMPTTSTNASALDAWAAGAGTSPATAMVSGAVSVLRQLKPTANLAEIEAAVRVSDKTTITDRSGATRSFPQMRVTAAANNLTGQGATPTPQDVRPDLVLTSSASGQVNTSEEYKVELTAKDANSNLYSVKLNWVDLPEESQAISGHDSAVSFKRTFTQAGEYKWSAQAVDTTGLNSAIANGQVTVSSGNDNTQQPNTTDTTAYMRMCIYSQKNYGGLRACYIFEQGKNVAFAGRWAIQSVKYLAFDVDQPYDISKDLATRTQPSVTFYNTTMARRRGAAAGVTINGSTPDLTEAMPNSWVSTIGFSWPK